MIVRLCFFPSAQVAPAEVQGLGQMIQFLSQAQVSLHGLHVFGP